MTESDRRTAPGRPALALTRARPFALGLLAAACIAGTQPASAQIDDYGGYLPPAYRYDDHGRYGYAPLPPAGIPPRAIGQSARENFGLARIDRMIRTDSAYVVDGTTDAGARTRLIFDRFSGRMIDRIVLDRPVRESDGRPARIARTDPRERPASPTRALPQPPARPPELKAPPSQAIAPATAIPAVPPAQPSPASPAAPAPDAPASVETKPTEAQPTESAAPSAPPPAVDAKLPAAPDGSARAASPAGDNMAKPEQPQSDQTRREARSPAPLPTPAPSAAPDKPAEAKGEITFPPFAPLE